MALEDIGFYTLSDQRALNTSIFSSLKRCELVLTGSCNFKCLYCRGLINPAAKGTIPYSEAEKWIRYWISEGLQNVRFTGGEPLLYPKLIELIRICKNNNVKRIAISTNGSFPLKRYFDLIDAGVNDLSISLDSGCCSAGEKMAGGIKMWGRVVRNIKALTEETYITLGMVFTPENIDNCIEHVLFADSLRPADIRVIPSAQYNKALNTLVNLPPSILQKYPILKYRINNIQTGRSVRGLKQTDCNRCWLALDDMASAQKYHFPCIIHLREGGNPIGKLDSMINVRQQRLNWVLKHNSFEDPICQKNCLDVCIDYNNTAAKTHKNK